MAQPLYINSKIKQQNNMAMQENEVSVMSIPRRFRNKSPINTEKEVDTYSTRKQVENELHRNNVRGILYMMIQQQHH